VVSLTANIHGVTLGEASQKLNAALVRAGVPPKGVSVKYRGQIPPLEQTINGLRVGLLLAILVIFLLLSANFQSVRLALAIVLTIPAVLCGVLLMLRITGTTLNVQSFMGAIMAIGVAVANAIPEVAPVITATFPSSFLGMAFSCLWLNKYDWAIGGQHLGGDHLGLERCSEVVNRRPVGVIVDDPEP